LIDLVGVHELMTLCSPTLSKRFAGLDAGVFELNFCFSLAVRVTYVEPISYERAAAEMLALLESL